MTLSRPFTGCKPWSAKGWSVSREAWKGDIPYKPRMMGSLCWRCLMTTSTWGCWRDRSRMWFLIKVRVCADDAKRSQYSNISFLSWGINTEEPFAGRERREGGIWGKEGEGGRERTRVAEAKAGRV